MASTASASRLRTGAFAAAGCAALLVAGLGGAANAAGCAELPVQGDGVVAAIVDARSIRLQDGREVRLAGIEPVPERRAEAIATVSAIVLGRAVTLRAAADTPDRYGRQPAFVFVDGDSAPVQSSLVAAGDALVGIGIAPPACRSELLAAESAARQAANGIWARGGVIKNAGNSSDILARIGQFSLIEGEVVSVRESGATLYLNFGRRWTKAFAVTISRRILESLEAAGLSPKSLKGKRIRVRGWVERRTGPMIAVRDVGQIEPAGGDLGR